MDLTGFLTEVEISADAILRRGVQALDLPIERSASRGKLLRPRLVYECAVTVNADLRRSAAFGAAIEMLHLASLCHDDVIDSAQVRRGRPSLNARVGNHLSVLLGDYLYSSAWLLASKQLAQNGASLLAETIMAMTRAEMLQSRHAWDIDTDIETYLRVIEGKTATLFAACARGTALLAQAEPQAIEALAAFGRGFGMAFQIMDDLVDYLAGADGQGKEALKDFRAGLMTLPLILALQSASAADRDQVQKYFRSHGTTGYDPERTRALVLRDAIVDECRSVADRYVACGIATMREVLPPERLIEFAKESLARAA